MARAGAQAAAETGGLKIQGAAARHVTGRPIAKLHIPFRISRLVIDREARTMKRIVAYAAKTPGLVLKCTHKGMRATPSSEGGRPHGARCRIPGRGF